MKKLSILLIALLSIGQMFAAEGTATINIRLKDSFGWSALISQYIECNDVLIGTISSNNCISLRVPAGNVKLKDYYENNLLLAFKTSQNPTKKTYEQLKEEDNSFQYINLYAQAGEIYYVKIDLSKGNPSMILEDAKFAKKYKVQNTLNWATLAEEKGIYTNTAKTSHLSSSKQSNSSRLKTIQSDVDSNIPQYRKSSEDTYALIIANEDYQFVDPVNFASHDGEVFKEYCIKTLGIPEKQVRYCANASYGVISGGVDWLKYALDNFEGSKAIVYYCGHGIPDEKTGDAYIVPVDGKGTNTATCYSLNKLYTTLASTQATNVTYFMDACFTGANKEGSMLVAARGVAREAKKEKLDGNAVVFSASSADETAMTYPEKGHGLFTYFLLKKLQETSGDVSYEELAGYINRNVKKEAFLINEKPQTPVVATSPEASSTWKSMKLK